MVSWLETRVTTNHPLDCHWVRRPPFMQLSSEITALSCSVYWARVIFSRQGREEGKRQPPCAVKSRHATSLSPGLSSQVFTAAYDVVNKESLHSSSCACMHSFWGVLEQEPESPPPRKATVLSLTLTSDPSVEQELAKREFSLRDQQGIILLFRLAPSSVNCMLMSTGHWYHTQSSPADLITSASAPPHNSRVQGQREDPVQPAVVMSGTESHPFS